MILAAKAAPKLNPALAPGGKDAQVGTRVFGAIRVVNGSAVGIDKSLIVSPSGLMQ